MKDAIEQVIENDKQPFIENKRTLRSLLEGLVSKAKPGNWAWQKLEREWGLDGDHIVWDHGNQV